MGSSGINAGVHGGLNTEGNTAVRGVMIDNPTPFTISEMTNNESLGILGNHLLFRGGDEGAESIMLLHNNPDIPSTPIADNLFQGGIDYAIHNNTPQQQHDFKFFFNYIEYDINSLHKILSEEDEDGGGDAWISVSAPSDLILNSDLDRGDAWKGIRNIMKHVYQ